MSVETLGAHDPIELSAPGMGCWIECECGWISQGFGFTTGPRRQHTLHVERSVPLTPDKETTA